ncbi:MAG: ribosome small subunit-dependent GTPase A [Oscillospiraceae bacterium]|nr:ribosome small subunit-dependent GTPase A [Oscillospiraceae bacterium]
MTQPLIKPTGMIVASNAGIYTVKCDDNSKITCKAKGLFRLKKISPQVGDFVTLEPVLSNFESDYESESGYVISEIGERTNSLIRPPLANLDFGIIVVSSCEPKPNALIIDRLTVIFESKCIEPLLVFTKVDKKQALLLETYREAGFVCFSIEPSDNSDIEIAKLKEYISGKTSTLIGNTGVGKTTLLNRLIGTELPTAKISRKLGRGKHTTRTVVLHELKGGGYIADTPGFSTVETKLYSEISLSDVPLYFREFSPLIGKCKFGGCTHHGEDGCAFPIDKNTNSRYQSYKAIYAEAKKNESEY